MNYAMKEDNQTLVLTHLSQLLTHVTGCGGFIVPLIIWLVKKNEIYQMDEQGRMIVNFQLSIILYAIALIPITIITLGFGGLLYGVLGLIALVFPIINAVKVSRGETPNYPLSIRFF